MRWSRIARDLSVWHWLGVIAGAAAVCYFVAANVVHVPHDYGQLWHGEKLFADGSAPYVRDPSFDGFVFAPSAAILLWPVVVSLNLSSRLGGLADLVLVAWLALGTWWAADDEDHRPSRVWTWSMLAVAYFLCARMGRGNVDIVTESLVLASLVVISKRVTGRLGQPWVAGLALGLAISVKVTVVPVLLLFLLLHEWVAEAVAVAVPLGLGAIAVVRVPNMTRWFTWTLPYLRSREAPARSLDISLHAVFPHASGALSDVFLVIGLVVVILVALASGLLRSDGPRSFSVLVLVSTMFVLVVFLASPGGLPYYWVYTLPGLVVLGVDQVAAIVAAVALAALAVPGSIADKLAQHPGLRQLDDLRGVLPFVLLFAALAIALRARTRARPRAIAVR